MFLTKQLLNVFKPWCEWGISVVGKSLNNLFLFFLQTIVSGAPFLFGAGSVILSLLLAFFLPDNNGHISLNARSPTRRNSEFSFQSECETSGSELRDVNTASDSAPLLSDTKPL